MDDYGEQDGWEINELRSQLAELREQLQASDDANALLTWQAGWKERAEAAEAALAAVPVAAIRATDHKFNPTLTPETPWYAVRRWLATLPAVQP